MLIPYYVDVAQDRRPYMNWALMVVTILISVWGFAELQANMYATSLSELSIGKYIAEGFKLSGLFGHMFFHAGWFHLIGNMLFMWVFGGAICSKIGNKIYLPVYILLGLCAGTVYAMTSDEPMLGASGAINGLVGMYLIFFPLNDISCMVIFYFRPYFFHLSSYWIILYWLAFDIAGLALDGDGVAYSAHLGGFGAGIILATVMLKTKLVKMESCERSLLKIFKHGVKDPPMEVSEEVDRILANRGVRTPQRMVVKAEAVEEKHEAQIKQQVVKGYLIEDVPDTPKYAIDQNDPSRESWVFNVPDPKLSTETLVRNGLIYFNCACGKRVKMPLSYAGKKGRCPQCNNVIHIPKLSV